MCRIYFSTFVVKKPNIIILITVYIYKIDWGTFDCIIWGVISAKSTTILIPAIILFARFMVYVKGI